MKASLTIRLSVGKMKNVFLYMFFIITAVLFLYQYSNLLFLVRFALMAAGAALGLWACIQRYDCFFPPIMTIVLLTFFWMLCYLGQRGYSNYSVTYLLYTLAYIGLSLLILKNEYSHQSSILIYAFFTLTILLKMVRNVSQDDILLANSRNYISILMMMPVLFYYISCHDKGKLFYVTPILLYFFICTFAIGRGGILSAAFLALSLCIYKAKHIENKNEKIFLRTIIFIVVFFAIINQGDNINIIMRYVSATFFRFFMKGTTDEVRMYYWTTFLKNNLKSPPAFFFGSDATLVRFDGNLHNSLLQAYASFGLGGFIFFITYIIRTYIQSFAKRDVVFVILFTGLMLRCATDRVFFQGYNEVFLFYFLFYWDYQKKMAAPYRYRKSQLKSYS